MHLYGVCAPLWVVGVSPVLANVLKYFNVFHIQVGPMKHKAYIEGLDSGTIYR